MPINSLRNGLRPLKNTLMWSSCDFFPEEIKFRGIKFYCVDWSKFWIISLYLDNYLIYLSLSVITPANHFLSIFVKAWTSAFYRMKSQTSICYQRVPFFGQFMTWKSLAYFSKLLNHFHIRFNVDNQKCIERPLRLLFYLLLVTCNLFVFNLD